MKSGYRPTRSCPHRLCPIVHLSFLPMFVLYIAAIVIHGLAAVLFLSLMVAVGIVVARLVDGKPMREVVADDLRVLRTGVILVVRPVWARIAVGLDLAALAACGVGTVQMLVHPSRPVVPSSPTAGWLTLLGGASYAWFAMFAHRMATRPARGTRVWLGAQADSRG